MKIISEVTLGKHSDLPKVRIVAGTDTLTLQKEDGSLEIRIAVGKLEEVTRRKLLLIARRIIVVANKTKLKRFVIEWTEFDFVKHAYAPGELAEILSVEWVMANYECVSFKNPPPEGWSRVEEVIFVGNFSKEEKRRIEQGIAVGNAVNATRQISNTPGGEMTPQLLADMAKHAAKGTGAKVKILGLKEMEKMGMGGVLGVGKGSIIEPRFIIVEWNGGEKQDRPLVLVGKGITFDTGGLNLKSTSGISDMHLDMSGGAAVIFATILAATQRVKRNVVALIPAAENMPSGSSYRPGDILRSLSGITIEIANTDAEGRVVLADALTYAERYEPSLVVDVATLTGAAVVALGEHASALFTHDDDLAQKFIRLGEESGDYLWRLPLWEEYEDEVKGTFGDLVNAGKNSHGGAIRAAVFLAQFAKKYPWVHLDIAPRMTAIKGEYLAKGASGAPVRILWKLIQDYR